MRVLGIESSCDETAAAIVEDGRTIISNVVATQIPFHQVYKGRSSKVENVVYK